MCFKPVLRMNLQKPPATMNATTNLFAVIIVFYLSRTLLNRVCLFRRDFISEVDVFGVGTPVQNICSTLYKAAPFLRIVNEVPSTVFSSVHCSSTIKVP